MSVGGWGVLVVVVIISADKPVGKPVQISDAWQSGSSLGPEYIADVIVSLGSMKCN
jgi:hypothetical protein